MPVARCASNDFRRRTEHLQASRNAADPEMERKAILGPLSAHAARIAERSLSAEIALAQNDFPTAISALREAVAIEDRIPYDEPPGWHAPTRHALGAALLASGDAAAAETAYRDELRRNPANGWSLHGLAQSLDAQRRSTDAQQARDAFAEAWRHADVGLTRSSF